MESKSRDSQVVNLPIFTYEFMPFEKPMPTIFESKEEVEARIETLKQHKQEIFQRYIDQIVNGTLIPKMNDKEYRCKTLYHQNNITIFKMENIKEELYDWNFGSERHKIGPNCHVIIDNRKDMQHIAIERKPKAFSSPNVVRKILLQTFKPLLKNDGLLIDINPQFSPKDFWDYIEANMDYGIKEIRFYFPYPNLPAISDKYGEMMKSVGLDIHCMPGLILRAPDDLDMMLCRDNPSLTYFLEAASESGIPVQVQTKQKGARMYQVGKNKNVTWPLGKNVLNLLDPHPDKIDPNLSLFDELEENDKLLIDGKIIQFANNGRYPKSELV